MRVQAKFDVSQVLAGLENMKSIQTHLARSMCVAGGKVLRDEAKVRAPVDTGKLRDSIYLAYRDKESTETRVVYQVSWNSKKAPHGHLLEFGHWTVYGGKRGKGGVQGEWVAARPFLRPAYDAAIGRAREAMIARGRERLIELMNTDMSGSRIGSDGGEGYE